MWLLVVSYSRVITKYSVLLCLGSAFATADGTVPQAALMQAMSTGNPVWPAAVIIEDAPTHYVNADFSFVSDQR